MTKNLPDWSMEVYKDFSKKCPAIYEVLDTEKLFQEGEVSEELFDCLRSQLVAEYLGWI